MVYCGKPSRGCQMCRTRRIKCDETKPTCNQCQKSRRQCPGYRDDFDIVFRNETAATEKRSRRGAKSARKISLSPVSQHEGQLVFNNNSESDEDNNVMAESGLGESSPGFPGFMSVPVEDQAPCFFISNFVRVPRDSSTRGSFTYLQPLIKSEGPNTHIAIAFEAVALAALANRPNSKGSNLMMQAIAKYGKALKAVNLALQNPAQQKTDATLASIMLLGFFETVTSERSNVMAWGSHVDGAAQLTKMRGKKQLRTKVGLALFLAVRSQMLVNCLSASKAPLISSEWWTSGEDIDKDGPGIFVTKSTLAVTELRHEVNTLLANSPRTPEVIAKIQLILKRCQELEHDFQVWERELPDDWRAKTVAWVDNVPGGDLQKAPVCPGKVDMYSDILIAVTLNSGRVCRLFVAGLIIRCVAWIQHPIDYRTTAEYATCSRIGVDMVTDIIASIPFHLGWRVDENGHLKEGDLSGFHSGEENVTSFKALGGVYSIWPLFCVSSSDYATDSQRTWIKGRMNLIADVMGLNQARVFGSFLLRLPSMIVRRDIMGHSPPTAAQYAAWAAVNARAQSQQSQAHVPITTNTISRVSGDAIPRAPYTRGFTPQASANYALSPIQQVEKLKREQWEKEKAILLKKASNFGGDATENIISNYLAI